MPFASARDYPRLRRGAQVLLEAQLECGHHRRYLRELADIVDFGGMTIATRRPLPTGSLVRLRLYGPPAAGDQPPLRATALVRWRRAWLGERLMALQFLEFEGLGGRSLARCLGAVLAAAGRPVREPDLGASGQRRWIAALCDLSRSAGIASRITSSASLETPRPGERAALRGVR